ncbi:MAG: YXWGXW repeat-containing protein [Planctomycetes bacterium]|nr:YXWGXW repeat-containing protein [Planctomycetota bacterium]
MSRIVRSPLLVVAAALAAGALLGGCHGAVVVRDRHPHRPAAYVAPAPGLAVVERSTVVAPGIVVQQVELVEAPIAPPAPRVEVLNAAPYPGAVWIPGNWVYSRHGWRWENGHWEHCATGHTVYVNGYWERRGHVHVWVPGRWR